MKKYVTASIFVHEFDRPSHRKSPEKIVRFLASTEKPIKYTHGHKGRQSMCNPYMKPISLFEAIDIVRRGQPMYVIEHTDYIDINTFSGDDISYANSLSIWN